MHNWSHNGLHGNGHSGPCSALGLSGTSRGSAVAVPFNLNFNAAQNVPLQVQANFF